LASVSDRIKLDFSCEIEVGTEWVESTAGEKNGAKERENGLKPSNGGQQLRTEKSFISRQFSREHPAGETVTTMIVGGARGPVNKTSPGLFQ